MLVPGKLAMLIKGNANLGAGLTTLGQAVNTTAFFREEDPEVVPGPGGLKNEGSFADQVGGVEMSLTRESTNRSNTSRSLGQGGRCGS
jgi:hypothetical protein